MTLIVETGTGRSDAESYASVADLDDYAAKRGISLSGFANEAAKEQALRKATDYMEASYRLSWKGYRVSTTQALSWPRYNVILKDIATAGYGGGGYPVPNNIVPKEVVAACVQLAIKTLSGELAPDQTQKVIREKVDVLEVEYDPNAPDYTTYRAVDTSLAMYLNNAGGSSVSLVRC